MEEEKKDFIEVEKVNETEKIENVEKVEQTNKTEEKTTEKSKKGFCIASLVLGIIALVFFCMWELSIGCGILAIIFGILGIKTPDKGMAIAGLVTGAIGVIVSTLTVIVIFVSAIIIGVSGAIDEIENEEYDRFDDYEWYDDCWDYE